MVKQPPPDQDRILAGIEHVAREHLGRDTALHGGLRLVEDLGLDSIQLLTLAVEVENHFRVCLDDDAEREIRTVEQLVRAVRSALDG